MKIKVIFTGGTIGSTAKESSISPSDSAQLRLIDQFRTQCGNDTVFDVESPYILLSENMTGEYLSKLLICVGKALDESYDGIIVTHGTDTLQYSAAALGYAFSSCRIPIVIVSSNYPLDDPRANGQDNFNSAVKFIESRSNGVFVSYKNSGNSFTTIHCATRLMKHREYSDSVLSIRNAVFGTVNGDSFIRSNCALPADSGKPFGICDLTKRRILMLTSYVGFKYPDNLSGFNAVLICPYHSGTIRTQGADFDAFGTAVKDSCKPVFLVGAMSGDQYESTLRFAEANINVLPEMSFPAAYIKLWLSCCKSSDPTEIKERMLSSLGRDIISNS